MSNTPILVRTKAGELRRFKGQLTESGLIVPPYSLIKLPFWDKTPMIEARLARFMKIASLKGPFLPYIIVRDNGGPEGTGIGKSIPVRVDVPIRQLLQVMQAVQDSSPDSRGVMLHICVGQDLGNETTFKEYSGPLYAPLLGGIAYTAGATVRGNAVVIWAAGHPAQVVWGKGGTYVAFNPETLQEEVPRLDSSSSSLGNVFSLVGREGAGGEIKIEKAFPGMITLPSESGQEPLRWHELITQERIFEQLFGRLLKLGNYGPKYLEWAITHVRGKTLMFALQASEPARKLAGLPTRMHEKLRMFDDLVRNGVRNLALDGRDADLAILKGLYEQAVADPQVVSAGFDVVGKERKEFDSVLWLPEGTRLLHRPLGKPVLIVFYGEETYRAGIPLSTFTPNGIVGEIPGGLDIGGLVALSQANIGTDKRTFRGHAHGYCAVRKIPGLGGFSDMTHKLPQLLPAGSGTDIHNRVMRGKFVLEVNDELPFGTLRVERVDKVERTEGQL